MARIQYSSIVSDIRGSIAGHTMQRGPFGASIRTKPKQLSNSSSYQNVSHVYMSMCHQAWSLMEDIRRKQWDDFINYSMPSIRKDRKILLSGHGLFLKYNSMRLHSGLDIITEFDYRIVERNISITDLYNDGLLLTIDFSEPISTEIIWVSLKLSGPLKNSVFNAKSALRMITLSDGSGKYWNLTNEYRSRFGAIPKVGDRIYSSIQVFSTTSPVFGVAIERFITVS